jgi:hypothetical protein
MRTGGIAMNAGDAPLRTNKIRMEHVSLRSDGRQVIMLRYLVQESGEINRSAPFIPMLRSCFSSLALSLLFLFPGYGRNTNAKNGDAPTAFLSSTCPETSIPEQQDNASPLPADVTAAWTKAGAEVGWSKSYCGLAVFQTGIEGKNGEVPALQFSKWSDGIVDQLPRPKQPFALSLVHAHITDTGLRELAGLTTLQSLSLRSTKLTDLGLKNLAGLKDLQVLDLSFTQTRCRVKGPCSTECSPIAGLKKNASDRCGSEGIGRPQGPPIAEP